MEKIPPLGPMLGRAAHLARSRMDARLNRYDVTPAQTHVLMHLDRSGGRAPQCEVTAFLRVKPSTANGILDRLEEKGMVARTVSGSDARRRIVALTDKGAAQLAEFRRQFHAAEAVMVRGLTPGEEETLRALLLRVIGNLEEDEHT